MMKLLLVNGYNLSSCSNIRVEVKTQNGKYKLISDNTTIIYRSINVSNFTMRCQCANNKTIPLWSFPTLVDLFVSNTTKFSNNRKCIMNKSLSFPFLKAEHSGYYRCHGNSSSIGFVLRVMGIMIV